jgi:hypothetical protein
VLGIFLFLFCARQECQIFILIAGQGLSGGYCRFKVGLLSEMPPTDFMDDTRAVSCLLGLNINRGQEIKLRLRTNDLRGFRNYQKIRETLVHELTHNVWSGHDNNFKTLNSQLLRECVQAAAQYQRTWSILGHAREEVGTLLGLVHAESCEGECMLLNCAMVVVLSLLAMVRHSICGLFLCTGVVDLSDFGV